MITIFQLLVYSCVTSHGFGGELMSKTCRWDSRSYYLDEKKCSQAGTASIGKPIFSDVFEDRKIEAIRCMPLSVD